MGNDKSTVEEGDLVHVFWTGGFDSTALLIRRLKEKKRVQPVYVRHSRRGDTLIKGEREDAARSAVRKLLRPAWDKRLLPEIVWDHDQFFLNTQYRQMFDLCCELAVALQISRQYGLLKAVRLWTGYEPNIELGVVMHDQLWWTLNGMRDDSSKVSFFNGYSFPFFNEEKIAIWKRSTTYEHGLLGQTYSCEAGTQRTCVERGLAMDDRCVPCRGRLIEVDT